MTPTERSPAELEEAVWTEFYAAEDHSPAISEIAARLGLKQTVVAKILYPGDSM